MKSLIKVAYQKIDEDLPAFKHAHADDAGYDLYATGSACIGARETRAIVTNIRICIPSGYVGLVTGRSGLNAQGIVTHQGTIDAGYTGAIQAVLSNLNDGMVRIKKGDRIGQLVILKLPDIVMIEEELPETERGSAGMGSTGR